MQSDNSDVCGKFCVMFSRLLTSGFGMHKFQNLFSSNYKKNDQIARDFYNNLIKKNKKATKKNSIMNCSKPCCN